MITLHRSREFIKATEGNAPVVALESTVLTHGLPRPQNLQLAHDMEGTVRGENAVPATIGFLDGKVHIGLNDEELTRLANENDVLKVGPRDFATIAAKRLCGGTTVAGTMLACKHAGIRVFATGGIGGMHRDALFDISADLQALATIPMIVLLEHPAVDQAAVVARSAGGASADAGDGAPPQLVAFVVAKGPGGVQGWRQGLAGRLPDHMVPSRLVEVPALPTLPNGKDDRRRLREQPLATEHRNIADEPVPSTREHALLSLWEGLLGRSGLAVSDNFFELGGHSLQVLQMVTAIEQDFEVTLSAADVFQHPTVRDLARRIEQRRGTEAHDYQHLFPIQPMGRKEPLVMAVPDFFAQPLAARFRGERPVYGLRRVVGASWTHPTTVGAAWTHPTTAGASRTHHTRRTLKRRDRNRRCTPMNADAE